MRLKPLLKALPIKVLLPLAIILVGGGAFALLQSTAEVPEKLPRTARAPVVAVQAVEKVAASPSLRLFGQVETPSMSILTAGVEADVVALEALEGEAVERGDLIILLDDADAKLAVREREADLDEIDALIASEQVRLRADQAALAAERELLALARTAVSRAEQLLRKSAGSQATLDQAREAEQSRLLALAQRQQAVDDFESRQRQLRARRDRAEAALQRAQRERKRTRVTAPFGGRITAVMASPGDRVARGAQLARMYDQRELEVRAQVPSRAAPMLRRALDASQLVRANANVHGDGDVISLTLHRLSADVAEGQGGVDAFFRARDASLPVPGETLEVALALPPIEGAVLLPPDAMYGSERVYLVRDGALQAQRVRRLGHTRGDDGRHLLIIDGDDFTHGDQVLISRLPQAVEGLRVEIVDE